MNNLSTTVIEGFKQAFQDYARKAQTLSDHLPEEQFWTKPFPFGNSFGHLVLHITGNLNYYIGTQIAATGYVRDRDREFTESNPPSKEEALRLLDASVEMVIATLEKQTPEDWAREYSAVGVDDIKDRFSIFLRCAAHFHHHVGQMIYLAKEQARQQ